ncbi:Cu(I)-responsive transcriptional regulator [Vibrio mexicanus]|uniref:Cu(I)-responsive transcriptional regulator n=1 Tax=Vibrio mexicanus TaxID=1004326 RepID=UPI00063CE85B|nr:Cu(I)-responsive transcriptional regulator [Vibrio mexicanus]
MNIGAIAELTGLSAKSIRLYEDKGLITLPNRSESGYREYTNQHVQELTLIAKSRKAGFSLVECAELASLARNPNRKSCDVKKQTENKLEEIEVRIKELKEIQKQLESWVSSCPGDSNSDCPIIDDLTKK